MLAHGSMLCPNEIFAVLSMLSLAPAAWAWARWRLGR